MFNRAVIEVKGAESKKFLQNLVTNDVSKHLYCYCYMLNNQGRFLFDFFTHMFADNLIYIDIDKSLALTFIQKLKFYRLRTDLTFTDITNDYSIIYSPQPLKNLTSEIVYSFQDPRYYRLGFRTLLNTLGSDCNNLCKQSNQLYSQDKYNFSIPDGACDMMYEHSIPIEYGGEELNAIDYHKGCYIGQEIISRTKYQGVVRKKIYRVTTYDIDISELFPENTIIINNQKIGVICSFITNTGIALIKESYAHLLQEIQTCTFTLAPWYDI